jgi:hypothetical protein
MRICLCFLGLARTFEATHSTIIQQTMDANHTYSVVYVTWGSENTEIFEKIFPNAMIVKIPDVNQESPCFLSWKEGLQMHISWRRSYDPSYALFRYFQQIYLWNQAALLLEQHQDKFDIMVRLRTDITYSQSITPFYTQVFEEERPIVFFSGNTQQHILFEGQSCPDQFFLAKPGPFLTTLQVLQHIHTYRINYLETKRKWFPIDTWERNIVQPESILFYYVKGNRMDVCYLPIEISIHR